MLLETSRVPVLQPSPVEVAELLRRICVRPPYFALQDLHSHGQTFSGTAVAERAVTNEVGPMQACEISRHAAIAGLCAAALTFEDADRRFYLAQDATYEGFSNPAPYGSVVTFHATLADKNKRQAVSDIVVTAGGLPLAQLRVTYTLLNEPSFRRLFRSKYSPSFSAGALEALRLERMPDLPGGVLSGPVLTEAGSTTTLSVDCVPELACAGHFEHYPAMPVAVLMGELGRVAGRHYHAPYWVQAATMSASDFCWAGEAARFVVTALPGEGHHGEGEYIGTAYAAETPVSDVTFRFAPGSSVPGRQTPGR